MSYDPKCFNEGAKACAEGFLPKDCPYNWGTVESDSWQVGFTDELSARFGAAMNNRPVGSQPLVQMEELKG